MAGGETMSTTTKASDAHEQQLDDVTRHGLAIYEERLKETLEREYMGKVVAIHPDTGDYVVADESPEAMRAMRVRQPEGLMYIRRIGPPTPGDRRKAARFAATQFGRK
jgi:hypothetical protein